MKIQPVSDLHFEFHRDHGETLAHDLPQNGDVLVVAGDLATLSAMDEALVIFGWLCDRFAEVVYVPGNHEFYGSSPAAVEQSLALSAGTYPNLHILNPGVVTLGDRRFVGAALWFPETHDEARYRRYMSDFQHIRGFVPWVHETHARHLAFLRDNVREDDVVVTHYLPHPRSVDKQFEDSQLNRFFLAEDAAPLVEERAASLWIHGHTHSACDYVVGKTRVVCNPFGYPNEGERVTGYRDGLVVELGPGK